MTDLVVERYDHLQCAIRRSRSASRRPPVLCFLHGLEEGAATPLVEAVTRHGPLAGGASPRADEFLIVAPRLAVPGERWLCHAQEVWEMTFDAARRFDGDRRALCLTGLRSGGEGVFELAAVHPDAWAALWSVNPTAVPPSLPEAPLRIDRDEGEGPAGCGARAYADAAAYDWMLGLARLRSQRGFTWIEVILILAVMGILATMAFPALQDQALRKQVREALALAVVAKSGVQAVWSGAGEMPADNKHAGVPEPEKIIGSFVSAVHVQEGAVTLTLGNQAHRQLRGKKLTVRPAVVADQKVVPISWLCHAFPAPEGMEVHGKDETDLPPQWLPVECRGGGSP